MRFFHSLLPVVEAQLIRLSPNDLRKDIVERNFKMQLPVANFGGGFVALLIWVGCLLRKWLKANPWTLNVTNREGKTQICHTRGGVSSSSACM